MKQVIDRAELLFSEVLNSLRQIVERKPGTGSLNSSMKNHELRRCLVDLEGMVHKEKSEFEVSCSTVSLCFLIYVAASMYFTKEKNN